MGFTKLDSGIINSSVWSEPLATRVLWVTMLAMSDHKGFVASSRSGLIRASNITAEQFDEAIHCLESPDEDSRTPDNDGVRTKKVDGGWEILNYMKYREYTYSNNPAAVRKREYRKKDKIGHVPNSIGHSASASASSSENIETIFKYWNEKSPRKHRSISSTMEKNVGHWLKKWSVDELKQCIDNYVKVLTSESSFYKYCSSLDNFFRPGTRQAAPCFQFLPGEFIEESFVRPDKAPTSHSENETTTDIPQQGELSLTVMQNRLYRYFPDGPDYKYLPDSNDYDTWKNIYTRMADVPMTKRPLLIKEICKELESK